ncbi:MAG: hypothetical protein LAT52_01970 [Balneolales bacterium]|nr:hypothetical protein [Balneolales bacterium]
MALVRKEYDATLPPDDRLRKLFSTYMNYAFGHPDPIVIAQRELGISMRPDLHESIADIFKEIQELIQACINDGRAIGLFRDVDVPLFIFTIAGMYDHMVNQVHVMQNLKLDGSIYGLPETDLQAVRQKIEHILWDITDSYLKKSP